MSRLLRLAAASAAVVTPTLMLAGTASAHSNSSSASCAGGVHALAQFYEAGDTNHITVTVGGNVVADVADFGTDYDQTFPVPPGGASTAWSVVIDSSDDAWDSTNSGTVGPCGEIETTTTTELVTTTTEQETTTSTTEPSESSTTSLPASTTSSTEPATTQPTTTLPTTSSLPSTSAPSSTSTSTSLPASTTSSSSTSAPPFSTTTPPTTPECSDNPTDDCAPILPPTGFIGGTLAIIAGALIGLGLAIGLVLRRRG